MKGEDFQGTHVDGVDANLDDVGRDRHVGEESTRSPWPFSPPDEAFYESLESQTDMDGREEEHDEGDGEKELVYCGCSSVYSEGGDAADEQDEVHACTHNPR